LLGELVRYDGRLISDARIVNNIGPKVEWLPFCPEVGCGMSVPREPVQLVGDAQTARMTGVHSRKDFNPQMERWIAEQLAELESIHPKAAILKSGSPSCAIHSLEMFDARGVHTGEYGAGLFARALMCRFPDLLMIDEKDVDSEAKVLEFLERIL
jgi:uncharacterized protein YbbK (DUF523 family)